MNDKIFPITPPVSEKIFFNSLYILFTLFIKIEK